jgi:copper ion binding protein
MASSTTEHVTLLSPDISCGHCVSTVQTAVGQLEGVAEVQASAETKFVDVDFDPSRTSLDEITRALTEAGYPPAQ